MIFPAGKDIRNLAAHPWTLCLFALNVAVYFLFIATAQINERAITMPEGKDLVVLGHIYTQYIREKTPQAWPTYQAIADRPSFHEMMGEKAIRNSAFVEAFTAGLFSPAVGDQIRVESLRKVLGDFRKHLESGVMYNFGVSEKKTGFEMISYQFVHYDLWHLLNNMVLLVLVGMMVEAWIGWVIMPLYFIAGWGGGLFHLKESAGNLPLVGASAAVTGLIGFLIVLKPKQVVRFFYFFSPFKGHYGYVFLPVWVLIPLTFLSDIVGWFSQFPLARESVGYTAHIGGWLVGGAVAVLTQSLTFNKYLISRPKKETRP